MLPPRIILRRLLVFRPSKPPSTTRPFTRNTNGRPHIPFLSVPLARNHQFRYLTTERKKWLAYEFYLGFKYTITLWAIVGISVAGYCSLQQEWLERKYPTPHEWGFLTRLRFRLAKWGPERTDLPQPDWVQTGNYAKNVLDRLEDEEIEGAGLVLVVDKLSDEEAYDITAKSEPWRRGYYEVLMLCAKAAEQLEDQVADKTRHLIFPADQVLGPLNPNPKPIPHGSPSAPHIEDCEPAYWHPGIFYHKILGTIGFTPRQKVDAALEYASWLDFDGREDESAPMYEFALRLATENSLPSPPSYNPQTFVLQDTEHPPSANVLKVLTAIGTYLARTGDTDIALPVFLSILRARRSLPRPQSTATPLYTDIEGPPSPSPWTFQNMMNTAKRVISPPAYPPPPDDGNTPPVRDARELCEEAGLNLYIGEIIYASSAPTTNGHEDGLAWTREAVDLAEEQLHKLSSSDDTDSTIAAKKVCRECLTSGLDNWRAMVARLAREERDREANKEPGKASTGSWFGLWGDGKTEHAAAGGRWAAEENVVKDRTKRALEVLEKSEAPKSGFMSLFWT